MGTVQPGVRTALPVVARHTPPEGTRAASITATLTPASFFVTEQFALSDQSGLMMTQVVTLLVDNTANTEDVFLTHGVLQQNLTVPAGADATVPTFSAQGYYPLSVTTASGLPPAGNLVIPIGLLNYERQQGFYSTPQSVNIANASIPIAGNVNANITNASLTVNGAVNVGTISGPVLLNAASVVASITAQVAVKQPVVTTLNSNVFTTVTTVFPVLTAILPNNPNRAGGYILMNSQSSAGAFAFLEYNSSGALGEMQAGDFWQLGGIFFNFNGPFAAGVLTAGMSAVFQCSDW